MIDAIVRYIEFLKTHFKFSVSIHGTEGRLDPYMSCLATYNIHSNPYCMFVKSSKQNWDICRRKQQNAANLAKGGMFFGSCYCGVGEYVIPIKRGEEHMGIISVGGYCGSPEKRDHFAEKSNFALEEVREKYKAYLSPDIPSPELVRTLIEPLSAMLILLFTEKSGSSISKGDAYVYGHILSYLHNHIGEKIQLSDIADFCHYSVSFVSRLFKAKAGMTVNEYLKKARMKKARELLSMTDMSISEIAEACGFSDANYFISSFSRHCGMSPKKFRSSLMRQDNG